MNIFKSTFTLIIILSLTFICHGQDTIRLNTKPIIIIKSWYPEFKEFPNLKIGDKKILFTIIDSFKYLPIRDNHIKLLSSSEKVTIKETEKPNQYLVSVEPTNEQSVILEAWFDLADKTILYKKDNNWINIIESYPFKNNRILLDSFKLNLIE